MAEREEFLKGRKPITFVDLFAGAGGISEGFLQSNTKDKYYDFILATDINENCELTHKVRYNKQLGLKTQFITEDIMSENFLPQLLNALKGKKVDVVTGGPSCQSFSLSGRRKRFDKRDNLFDHYLKVIRALKPKYFVMENVKGILTKDKGRFKTEIMREMRSMIDDKVVPNFLLFVKDTLSLEQRDFFPKALLNKLQMEMTSDDKKAEEYKRVFFEVLNAQFKAITKEIDYRASKSDPNINTIRHGLVLLSHNDEREKISNMVVNEKTRANIDNDVFVNSFNDFLASMTDESIAKKIIYAIDNVEPFRKLSRDNSIALEQFKQAIDLYSFSLDECLDEVGKFAENHGKGEKYAQLLAELRLYNINQMVLLSSNYGVPQNRERVVYIGSRKDQAPITEIPATVDDKHKVTVYEAIRDLDFIGNGETITEYRSVKPSSLDGLIVKRGIDGMPMEEGKTYAEWSREGRLNDRFSFERAPFYVRSMNDMDNSPFESPHALFNHQTSAQNYTVRQRLQVIAECGGYTNHCKELLKAKGLESAKRNYFVLDPKGQSPTVVTMPDDFIHYSAYRAMTVREMARLQSFDDNFVFQGKRQTGGEKRKIEIPQYTLVGNAVPPLMARAIGNAILSHIK